MELVLNIYSRERDEKGNRIISKTYKANDYELLYGVIEDVLNLFDPNVLKDEEKLLDIIQSARNEVNDLLKDIFFGITDEELRYTTLNEIVEVVVNVLKYSIVGIIGKAKNVVRG